MQKEKFWGLGRSWLMAIIIIVSTTTLAAIGQIEVGVWQDMVKWVFAAVVAKSGLQKIGEGLKK